MNFVRRSLGALVVLVAILGFVCLVGSIGGIWMGRQYLSEKLPAASARLDGALESASAAARGVRRALETARVELAKVNKESANAAGGDQENRAATALLQKSIRRRVGPRINELGGQLATFSDAATVVSSLLRSFQELASDRILPIQPDNLERATNEAVEVSAALRKFQSVVGDGDKTTSLKEYAAAQSEVDSVLRRCQDTVSNWQSDLDSSRERLSTAKTQILDWLTPAAIALTLVCLWLALSQISMFEHARKWGRSPEPHPLAGVQRQDQDRVR
jgi:hypothetical protein